MLKHGFKAKYWSLLTQWTNNTYTEAIKNLLEFWETCISLKTNYSKIYHEELTINWSNNCNPNISATSPI